MPLDYCHPETPHKKLALPEWYVSSLMMDRALDAVVRRAKKIDRNHDIPYLAGYSNDGKTIYIDRHMPAVWKYRGREIDTDRYLILHEEVEKTLIDQLGLHYLHAHQIATRAEQAAVRAAGITWRDYDRFMQKYVKVIGDEQPTKVPADLDLKPYRDEHDYDLLKRMGDGSNAASRRRMSSRSICAARSSARSPTSTRIARATALVSPANDGAPMGCRRQFLEYVTVMRLDGIRTPACRRPARLTPSIR